MDRMLTQLGLAGVLGNVAGLRLRSLHELRSRQRYGSLTLLEVLEDHIGPLGIPAWYGSMIGHIADNFTVPLGIQAEIDADEGTIKLLEPAVV